MTAADIIKRNRIGVVTDDYCKEIMNIYTNPKKYVEMARRGKAWVRENLSWEKFGQRMLKIFQNLKQG